MSMPLASDFFNVHLLFPPSPTTVAISRLVLRQYQFYRQLKGRGRSPLHRQWIGAAAEPGDAITHYTDGSEDRSHCSQVLAGFLG